jgi:hypothetical protein
MPPMPYKLCDAWQIASSFNLCFQIFSAPASRRAESHTDNTPPNIEPSGEQSNGNHISAPLPCQGQFETPNPQLNEFESR